MARHGTPRWITTGTAARLLGYSGERIRQFARAGEIQVDAIGPGGDRFFTAAELARFCQSRADAAQAKANAQIKRLRTWEALEAAKKGQAKPAA